MTHPLIDRLTVEMGWPLLAEKEALAAYVGRPGIHVLFVPGDPKRNLETADVAVILPELKMAFQGKFDCAVVADAIEADLRQDTKVLKTPSLIFFRAGKMIGALPKVRDWDEYVLRITQMISHPEAVQ